MVIMRGREKFGIEGNMNMNRVKVIGQNLNFTN